MLASFFAFEEASLRAHAVSTKNRPPIRTFKKQELLAKQQELQLVFADQLFMTIFKDDWNKHKINLPPKHHEPGVTRRNALSRSRYFVKAFQLMPTFRNAIDSSFSLIPQRILIDNGPSAGSFKPDHFILGK